MKIMSIEDFDKTRWGAGMKVTYHGKERDIASVDFQEKLIGLVEDNEIGDPDEESSLDWVRCENCELA
jgi:hypothetical protein